MPDPPFGTDSDSFRDWATTSASDAHFLELYGPRAKMIRHKQAHGIRVSAPDFLARLDQLCP